MRAISILGYACANGANHPESRNAPLVLEKSDYLQQLPFSVHWDILYPNEQQSGLTAIPSIAEICTRLANKTAQYVKKKQPFICIGGDHTCAIGTWSGVASSLKGSLGLLWLDAHMDSHTPTTTYSGNVHGFPVATLLGYGDPRLTHLLTSKPKLNPENICLIGVRSFEPEEKNLLQQLKVRVYTMEDVQQRGFDTIFNEGLDIIKKRTAGIGISLDLDVIDPKEAPGVNTPEPGGIHTDSLYEPLHKIVKDPLFTGIEIVEFNPHFDQNRKTELIIKNVIETIEGEK